MNEPDKAQWPDEATGLPCLIVRNPRGGNLCGYVGVAEGHSLFEQDYGIPDVDVHGGLTFADKCTETEDEGRYICHVPDPGEPKHVWWFGFDCAHLNDLSPADPFGLRVRGDPYFGSTYRDFDYVKRECARLATQLAAVA